MSKDTGPAGSKAATLFTRLPDDVTLAAYCLSIEWTIEGEAVAGSSINKNGIKKFMRDLQREFDHQGPIRVPVETEMPDLPPLAGGTTVNYNGPVFNGDVTGAQIAWGNETVTQNQQYTSTVAPGFEELAKFVTELLQQLPQLGLDDRDRHDAEAAARDVLTEITQADPDPGRVRQAINILRGWLAPVATGAITGMADGAQAWAQAAITGLSNIT